MVLAESLPTRVARVTVELTDVAFPCLAPCRVPLSRLTTVQFEALQAENLFDSACDSICSTLYVSHLQDRYPKTIQVQHAWLYWVVGQPFA